MPFGKKKNKKSKISVQKNSVEARTLGGVATFTSSHVDLQLIHDHAVYPIIESLGQTIFFNYANYFKNKFEFFDIALRSSRKYIF